MQQIKFYRVTSLPTAESNQTCEVGSLYFVHDDVNNFNDLYVCTGEYQFESYSGHLYWSDGSDGGFGEGGSWGDDDTGESIDPSLYLPLTGGTLTGNLNLANGVELLFEDGQTGKIVQIQDGLEFWMGSTLILTMTSQGIVSTKFITQGATDQDLLLGTGNTIAMSDLDYLPLDASKPITGTVQFTTDEWLATEAGTTVVSYNQTDNDLRIGDISELNSILLESADGVNIPNGNLTLESGEVHSGAFYETSDARKKDIKSDLSLDKCYDLIDKCQTVIYSLKDQTKEQVGMIAQEIEEFFPEVVATDEEGFKSLAYDRLVVICFKVLKDVIKRLEKLEQ